MHDDEPAFVSPPFPIIFLTVAKVIVAVVIWLSVVAVLLTLAAITIDQFVWSFTD